MNGHGARGARPAPRASTIDVLLDAARVLHETVYKNTAHTVVAVGIGVDAETFTRCVMIARDRFKLEASAFELEAQGWIDFEHPAGFKMRIAVDG